MVVRGARVASSPGSGPEPRTGRRAATADDEPGPLAPGDQGEQDRHHRQGAGVDRVGEADRRRARDAAVGERDRGQRGRDRERRGGRPDQSGRDEHRPVGMRSPTVPVTTSVAQPAEDQGPARRRSPIAPPTSSRIADATTPRRRTPRARALADGRLHGRQPRAPDLRVEARREQGERARQERRPRLPILEDVGEDLGQRRSRHPAAMLQRRGTDQRPRHATPGPLDAPPRGPAVSRLGLPARGGRRRRPARRPSRSAPRCRARA